MKSSILCFASRIDACDSKHTYASASFVINLYSTNMCVDFIYQVCAMFFSSSQVLLKLLNPQTIFTLRILVVFFYPL